MKNIRFFLLLIPIILACQTFSPKSTPTQPPPIALASITFDNPETQEEFLSLNNCMVKLTSDPDSDWQYLPYTNGGAFIRAKWCQGAGARADCQITDANQHQRDQHALELYTLHYGDDVMNVFGLGMSALWVPPDTGWGAAFSFSEGGRTIIGEGFWLSFMEYGMEDAPLNELHFGMSNEYKMEETTLTYPAQLPLRDELALYLASPESFLTQGQKVLAGLSETVQASLDEHTITACDYGPYEGNGIPPACNPRPLTVEEELTAQKTADEYFTNQKDVLAENYDAMFATLEEAFPFDACWDTK